MKHLKSHPESKVDTFDPVYHFFFKTSVKERKKIFIQVLKKTQKQQEETIRLAYKKCRA